MKMTQGHRTLLVSLLLAGPLTMAMHSQTPPAPQSPQQTPAAARTPRPEVAMEPERARALYVSNKPEDLPTCNCERDLDETEGDRCDIRCPQPGRHGVSEDPLRQPD